MHEFGGKEELGYLKNLKIKQDLADHWFDRMSMDISESEVTPLVFKSQSLMINSQ